MINKKVKTSFVVFLLILVLTVLACGCSANENSANDVNAAGQVETETVSQNQNSLTNDDSSDKDSTSNSIDIDLTKLNSLMTYSEVFNIVVTPEDYVGKTIKMSGKFSTYMNFDNNENRFSVIIQDATECCEQGLEFLWTGDHKYPDDYPKLGTEITVTGVFQPYEEHGYTWYHLICDDIEINE